MSRKEFLRLKAFDYAKKHQPRCYTVSRRTAKSKSNATGQILKSSRIEPQVWLEKVFVPYNF
jgi:phage FluMu protein Com